MANGKNWIDLIMQKHPQANKDILEFIYNFFSSHSSGIEDKFLEMDIVIILH